MRTALVLLLVATTSAGASGGLAAGDARPAAAATVAAEESAFGATLRIETIAAPGAEAAVRKAVAAVREMEAATDGQRGALAELNAHAGAGAQKPPATLLAVLARALSFCQWSEGTFGPLGGALNEIWGLRTARPSLPGPIAIEQATSAAACDQLALDLERGTATLAAGARIDLWGFEAGAALDRAAEVLAAGGVRNASLSLGRVQRGVGEGPDGRGWPLRVEVPPSLASFTDSVMLRDQSFALASRADGSLRAGGETYPPYLDQSQGRPGAGVEATVAIAELALDAQALAATLFTTGPRRGGLLLGQLQPPPAALWVLGDGTGEPLVSDYRWGTRQRRGAG